MQVFTKAQVPLIGPFTGAEAFRRPFNRYIFNVRASYFAETDKLVELLSALKMQRIAVFYQNDAYGKAGLEGVERAAKARNMPIAATATVERNSTDVATAVAALPKGDPQAIVMISAYKSCAAFIRAARKGGFTGTFYNVSFVGTAALAKELGADARGVVVSQVMPFPYTPLTPIAGEYREGFLRGYEVGVSQLRGEQPWEGRGDPGQWVAPREFSEWQRRGFRDGVDGAQKDYDNHRWPSVLNRWEYNNPQVPPEFARDYRRGFRRGYEMAASRLWGGM